MKALVTGCAGFIGSSLTAALLDLGADVVGIDVLTTYYSPEVKRDNLSGVLGRRGFDFAEVDLQDAPLRDLLAPNVTVFHLAGQPGVRASWGDSFKDYVERNIATTQRLLEACREQGVERFVNSSSSSVYGRAEQFPTRESDLPAPISPSGVTKLAAEHLATLYGTNFGLPTVSLRYFTVYGPGQRPDMAHHRLIEAALAGTTFVLNGDGSQIRDFTYVDDAVKANLCAARADVSPGEVFNIGGGSCASLREVIDLVEEEVGAPVPIETAKRAAGDPRQTGAWIEKASAGIGWSPGVDLRTGIENQVAWHRTRMSQRAGRC